MIEVEGLVRRFRSTTALDGIDLAVSAGSVLALLGPNGSGKTTTIRILSTLLRPDAGRVTVAGFDLRTRPMAVRAAIGLTGQYASVDETLTGRENLELIGSLLGLRKAERKARAAALLRRMDLAAAAGRSARTYSGGMRRRLDLAVSLCGRPRVLFLDEPTAGLDPHGRIGLWDTIRDLVAEGATVLLTTQYLEEADQLADRIVMLDRGRVIAEGTSAELKARTGGQVLDIQAPADDLAKAADVLADLGGGPHSGAIRVPAPGPAVVAESLRRLEAAGIAVTGLALHQPSLDEVFIRLTGSAEQPA
ncbi:MAG: ATP-binding cassette domain-containing protein [Streptosporangiaceae bacterium]|nr:ATP-binding cassette domain-containing protein [Streptosporangiaceae bacterium]